jgi:hypothetical protein
MTRIAWFLVLSVVPSAARAECSSMPADCPHHAAHAAAGADHSAQVDSRGDAAMGFSHRATVHHFLLTGEGGVIAVGANEGADASTVAAIRSHLAGVARAFAQGDFALPKQIHDRIPPGVPEMVKKRAAIAYRFEETPDGGRVVITTRDARARDAIHEFLRFQIADHRTGDPTRAPAPTAAAR